MNDVFSFAAGLIAGIMGAMGLGSGTVLVLYLTLALGVDQLTAQGINLMFFIPSSALSLGIYIFKKQVKVKELLPIIFSGLPAALLGFLVSDFLGNKWSGKLFGAALIAIGIRELLNKRDKKEKNFK